MTCVAPVAVPEFIFGFWVAVVAQVALYPKKYGSSPVTNINLFFALNDITLSILGPPSTLTPVLLGPKPLDFTSFLALLPWTIAMSTPLGESPFFRSLASPE